MTTQSPSPEAVRDVGKLLKQRDAAIDQIFYGRLASIFLAILGAIFAVSDASENPLPAAGLRVALYLAIGAVGFALRANRIWTGWLLLTLLASTLVLSMVTGTLSAGLPYRVAVLVVCVNGAVAVFRHRNLNREIKALRSEEPPSDA